MTQLPAILLRSAGKPSLNKVVVGAVIAGVVILGLILWMVWQVDRQMQGLQHAQPVSVATSAAGTSWAQLPITLPPGAVIKHWEATQQWIIWEVQVGAQQPYWLVYDLQAQRVRVQLMPQVTDNQSQARR